MNPERILMYNIECCVSVYFTNIRRVTYFYIVGCWGSNPFQVSCTLLDSICVYMHMYVKIHTTTLVYTFSRKMTLPQLQLKGQLPEGSVLRIDYYPVVWEYSIQDIMALPRAQFIGLSFPFESFSGFRICEIQLRTKQ